VRTADASRVKELAEWSGAWGVSIVLPPHPIDGKEGGDALRMKNLLADAENELVDLGLRRADATRLLDGTVPGELSDPQSEIYHRAGIAVFAGPDIHRAYRIVVDTPEMVAVADRFHLKPLLAGLARERRFFVLALSRGHAALYAGDGEALVPLRVPGMPVSLDDAIQYDDRERMLMSHSASRRGGGGVVAAFHGQGDRADHLPEDVMRYLRMVNEAVAPVVGVDGMVVLAGSQDLLPRYRELMTRGVTVDHDITGSAEDIPLDELHRHAWGIVDGEADGTAGAAAERFEARNGTGTASMDPIEVIEAARYGRVDTLFVAADARLWGRFGEGADSPEIHDARMPGDADLLDGAAVDAWRTGASVHVVPSAMVPGSERLASTTIAALFRY
jgi:hypothetical protein